MQILQIDANNIHYELVKPEIKVYEETENHKVSLDDILVLFISIEKGDSEEIAKKAIDDAANFMKNLKRQNILLYPFAHLSSDLESPEKALIILKTMRAHAAELKLNVYYAPFGWNKKFGFDTKGHPLAEQSRHYGANKIAEPSIKHDEIEESEEVLLAKTRKSNFSGLPDTDHRIIGEKLDLFSFQEPSPGMVYWHNKGVIMRNLLMDFVRSEVKKRGYIEISTPTLANVSLWKVSGHWDHYKDEMFLTNLGKEEFGMKPMNCPSTFLVYKSKKWSYKDLPLKIADFDQLYRNELSGVASGLFRVKMLTQDDAHIFISEDQIEGQISELLDLVKRMYSIFDLEYFPKLSTMPDKHMGTEAEWRNAENLMKKALEKNNLKYGLKEKDGAFYGPKIDIGIKDSMGREWQCATIQLDYQLPKRFRATYTGEDGKEHTPIVVHRVIYGSIERFIGILIEHYQGAFPTWLAPVQAIVVSISEQANDYASKVKKELEEAGIRTDIDILNKTLEYKIREAQLQKIPYIIIIGKKEVDNRNLSIRSRAGAQKQGVDVKEFIATVKKEVEANSSKLSY
jgi:threonyl-tRNA synthetase